MSTQTARDDIVTYLRRQLIGPGPEEQEVLREAPGQRYLLGVLYPRKATADEVFEADVIDEVSGEGGDESGDDPVTLASQHMPSSVGISFVVTAGSVLEAHPTASVYEGNGAEWTRRPVAPGAEPIALVEGPTGQLTRQPVLDGKAELTVLWRAFGDDRLVTVAVVNLAETPADKKVEPSTVLCQVGLEVRTCEGGFLPYPTSDRTPLDPEDEEQALLYRHLPTYAVGHGCAADWDDGHGRPLWVRTEYLPTEIVPGITFDIAGFDDVRSLLTLSKIDSDTEQIVARLTEFVAAYRSWIDDTVSTASVPARLEAARSRLTARLVTAADRMDEGVRLLRGDAVESQQARVSFALANRAMLMQMRHSREDLGGLRRARAAAVDPTVDYEAFSDGAWRPFQLAFLLLTIPSVSDLTHPDRDVVDLIWFPTGGGKTEAYLGLVAYQVFLRRLTLGDQGAGTTVITRYTLRLLTTQQFQRAATLTCAMELLRRRHDEILGTEPVTIGIWVGGSTTPNTFSDAVDLLEEMKRGDRPARSFQLETCPWCGTEVVPEQPTSDDDWGVTPTNDDFLMHCPNDACPFRSRLPVSVVDEHLYRHPPTFLIATIDKFARLAWDERSGVFLGAGELPGPSLVIQDELHLISGPLGTVAALYEAAFDVIMDRTSARPKVVASTATIRRADRQVRGIFDRDVFLFPPSGMSADDSFFVREDPLAPGRRYVGVMAQSHTPTTAAVHTTAALLQAPVDLGLSGSELDAYWTLVAYHNSLRELGKTVTLARDDVPARISVIARMTDKARRLDSDADLIELTSNIPSVQIPKNLEILGREHGSKPAVSVVACTNMISVGVDVPRLGLMLVVGQPKSTSEYIQATSRVGRDPKRPPGLVVTLYSAAKPRDRSHYESFKAYHRGIYREVEPTSVTPWALPARERALHAAFVILVRHLLGLRSNAEAAAFKPGPDVDDLIAALVARVSTGDEREVEATSDHLRRLVDEWVALAHDARGGGLRYQASGKQATGLLRTHTSPTTTGWATLNSMRNVDFEALVKVSGERK